MTFGFRTHFLEVGLQRATTLLFLKRERQEIISRHELQPKCYAELQSSGVMIVSGRRRVSLSSLGSSLSASAGCRWTLISRTSHLLDWRVVL